MIKETVTGYLDGDCLSLRDLKTEIPSWIYRCFITYKSGGCTWSKCIIDDNKKLKFFNSINLENIDLSLPLTIEMDEEDEYIQSRIASSKAIDYVSPIIPDIEEDKYKHLEDEIKILKTKNSMLENKLKFYESEIALIKSTLGL